MIQVSHITKRYGSFLALDDINFEIEESKIVAFLGPNGAGKTTTMRILTGFMPPDSGMVKIDDMDVFEESDAVKTIIGYLPENPPLYPDLTVLEYLSFVAELRKVPKSKIKAQVDNAVDLADLGDRRNTLIKFLSKGLKQRVGIAQSIVNSPKVLILDEPTVGLDPKQVVDVRNLIRRLGEQEKRTIILSTHILAEAEEICEKAVIINNGKIIAVDDISAMKNRRHNEMKITVRTARNPAAAIEKLKKLPEIKEIEVSENGFTLFSIGDMREQAAKTIVESGCGLLEMSHSGETLEDVFIKLVQ